MLSITGFTVTGATGDYKGGIYLYGAENCNIANNNASNNYHGIYLSSSSNNSLTDNTANSNNDDGITLSSSSNNMLMNNTAEDNKYGIYLSSSSNNSLTSNTAYSNNRHGIYLSSSSNNSLTGNIANSNNDDGISLYSSSNNSLTGNIANLNNEDGIYLYSSSNNSLTGNIANLNNEDGIYLSSSSNNMLMNNTAEDNKYGIWLSSSSNNNHIYNNYFNNTNNARDSGNNTWNSTKTAGTNIIGGPYIGGNYWSDYAGEDLNGDGLGDTQIPYDSSGDIANGGDLLPLVQVSASSVFDTGTGTYPSIQGTHEGKIKPSCDIEVSKLYTYPCAGTGGHTRSIVIYENDDLKASGNWIGYQHDWQNITITPAVTLKKGREYRYVIETGSYPQIIHVHNYTDAIGGTITCDKFTDVNGKVYTDWIPAIRLS